MINIVYRGGHPVLEAIAREAGVSKALVSAILNGRTSTIRFSEATRKRVLDVASRYAFVPNFNRRNRDNAGIMLLAPSANPYYTEVQMTLQVALRKGGRELCAFHLSDGDSIGAFIERVAPHGFGFLILSPVWFKARARDRQQMKRVFGRNVFVLDAKPDATARRLGFAFCNTDFLGIYKEAIAVCAREGTYRRLGYISDHGGGGWRASPRYHALRQALKGTPIALEEAGADHPPPSMDVFGAELCERAYARARRLLASGVDLIIAHNDLIVPAIYKAIGDAGKRVGADVGVFGSDDLYYSAYLTPPLSTVRLHLEKLTEIVPEWLMRGGTSFKIPHEVVLRESLRI
jgi:LacI family transcriptional regulator